MTLTPDTALQNFTNSMAARIASKDEKYGGASWGSSTAPELAAYLRLANAKLELAIELSCRAGPHGYAARAEVALRAVDVANFAMMIATVS